jgi:hypothetical protein
MSTNTLEIEREHVTHKTVFIIFRRWFISHWICVSHSSCYKPCRLLRCDAVWSSRIINPSDQQTSATLRIEKEAKQAAGNKPTAFLVLLPACFFLLPSVAYSSNFARGGREFITQYTSSHIRSHYSTGKLFAWLWDIKLSGKSLRTFFIGSYCLHHQGRSISRVRKNIIFVLLRIFTGSYRRSSGDNCLPNSHLNIWYDSHLTGNIAFNSLYSLPQERV